MPDYVPALHLCGISGGDTFTQGKYTLDASIDIIFSSATETPDVCFEKYLLVTELNGKEINREDISEDALNYPNYPYGEYFRNEYHMECEASEGDEPVTRLEATGFLGYVHKMIMHFGRSRTVQLLRQSTVVN